MANIRQKTSLFVTTLLLGACGSNLDGMPDADLQEKIFECSKSELSPGMAISCDNYRRECSRRREEGRFVC